MTIISEETMRYSILAAAGSLIIAATSSVLAADLPGPAPYYKSPPPAAVYAPVFSWTGFYIGGNAGWGWSKGDGNIAFGGPSGSFSGDGNGFLGGVQIGYNWQAGNWVYGLEADFQGSAGKGDVSGGAGAVTFSGDSKTPWFATARGRIGYAFGRSMVYGTGGAVYGKSTLDGTIAPGGSFSDSTTYWTWTAGLGYETMLWDRWSAKLEYLYMGTPSDVPVPPGTSHVDGSANTSVLRVGLNYHF
jgi:outer membrane immunogenic protein